MKEILKKVQMLCAVLLLLLTLSVTVGAADSNLQIVLKTEGGVPSANIEVEIAQVVSRKTGTAILAPAFSEAGVSVAQLMGDSSAARAKALYQYVIQQDLTGQTGFSSADGRVQFDGLEKGLYLVFERGEQEITFLPFLVWLHNPTTVSEPKTEESGSKKLTVVVEWDDGNNADGLRPGLVTVTLLRSEASTRSRAAGAAFRKAVLSDANNWKHTFTALPESGLYGVAAQPVSGYTVEISQTDYGFLIIYRHRNVQPDAEKATVKKVWDDKGNAAGVRPDSITVQLVKNDTVIQTAVLSESNEWSTTFWGLSKDGGYSVLEIPVTGYTASYNGNTTAGFVIVNSYAEGPDDPQPEDPQPENPPTDTPTDPTDPNTPSDPPKPNEPTIPQTGAYTYPMYFLFAAGVIFVLLGTAVLRWRPEET